MMPGYNDLEINGEYTRLDSLLCPSCNLILRDAIQTEEGVRLCKTCCENILSSPNTTCTKSGLKLEPNEPIHPDIAVRREVERLPVKCANHKSGCPWTGKLKDHEQIHKHECTYKTEICPNRCGKRIPIDQMHDHLESECQLRQIQCPHCETSLYARDYENHQFNCIKAPYLCEWCGKDMAKIEMDKHKLVECSIMVECVGCSQQLTHKDTCARSCPNRYRIQFPIAEVQIHVESQCQLPDMESPQCHIRLISGELILRAECLFSPDPVFEYLTDAQMEKSENPTYHSMAENLVVVRQHILCSFMLGQSQHSISTTTSMEDATILPFPMAENEPTHCYKEEHQMIRDTQWKEMRPFNIQTNEQIGHELPLTKPSYQSSYDDFQSNDRLIELETKIAEQERLLGMLKGRISELELQLQASLASTYNGSLLWRIPDIRRRRREAIDGKITSIYSPPFYTGRNGYKMCIRAYLNGDGIGYNTHVSIFFVLMKGEYDPLLKWPFDYKVSLIMVDQDHRRHIVQSFKPSPSSSSFQRPKTDMNIASGCPKFAELKVLDNDSYVKDDVMYIKCIVDTTRIFHP